MPRELPKRSLIRARNAAEIFKNAKKASRQSAIVAKEAAKFLEAQPPAVQNEIKKILSDLPSDISIDPLAVDFASMKPGMGLAKMIQSATNSGQRVLELWMRVLMDENQDLGVRLQAAEQLANRGFGRPPQEVVQDISVTHKFIAARLGGLSDDELASLDSPADLDRYKVIDAEVLDGD